MYRVDPARSDALLYVYREGTLAGFGHNHVIRVGDLVGLMHMSEDLSSARADLAFSAAALEVDPPEARRSAGPDFATALTETDVRKTRENMLGPRVLDAANHPFVTLRVHLSERRGNTLHYLASITLKGVTHTYEGVAELSEGDDWLELTGTLSVSQGDFGMVPFSLLGGALRVRDEVELRYRIHAAPFTDS
ncbi:MAG: YceI family protein [Gammaproteobacteria bacterium]